MMVARGFGQEENGDSLLNEDKVSQDKKSSGGGC